MWELDAKPVELGSGCVATLLIGSQSRVKGSLLRFFSCTGGGELQDVLPGASKGMAEGEEVEEVVVNNVGSKKLKNVASQIFNEETKTLWSYNENK